MKAILISINPKWVAKILNGNKTIEIRKKFPKDYVGWVYIYCTKNGGLLYKSENDRYLMTCLKGYFPKYCLNGKVVARFWCDKVEDYVYGHKWSWENGAPMWGVDNSYEKILKDACLTDDELRAYADDLCFSAIHITKLEIFDKPLLLNEHFYKVPSKKYVKWCKENSVHRQYIVQSLTRAPQSWCYISL